MQRLLGLIGLSAALAAQPGLGQGTLTAPADALPTAATGRALDPLWQAPLVEERYRASSADPTGGNRDRLQIAPGRRAVLLGHEGAPGSLRRIWFTLASDQSDYLATAKLRFTFDGHVTVDDVPIGMLLGTGPWRVNDLVSPVACVMRSRQANRDNPGAGRGSFNLLWPMPFARDAKVEVFNDGKASFTIHYHIDYQLHPVEERPLWFHATYRRESPTTPLKDKKADVGQRDYVFADVQGAEGRYVGTILAVESHPSRVGKWYEGDDRFLIDGKRWLHGTGTEDYFGMAWGVHRPYQGHDHGVTHYQRNLTEKDRFYDGRFVVYRWHLADPIVFRKSLRASIEAGHANECAQHYESVAIWYGRPSP